jgi:excisionase family DNA binding protein
VATRGKPGAGEEYVSALEAAETYGFDEKSIYRLVRRGELPAYRIGSLRSIRIRRSDLDALLKPIPAVGAQ